MRLPAEMRRVPASERGAFAMWFLLSHYFPENRLVKARQLAVRQRVAAHVRRAGRGRVIQVQRVESLSPEQFRRQYLFSGTPVIISRAAIDWPCTKNWSFDGFSKLYGDLAIKLVNQKGLCDDEPIDGQEFSEELPLRDFLAQVTTGGMKYMRFSPLLEMIPELLKDFDQKYLKEMPGPLGLGTTFQAFIGGAGTFTPLHNSPTPFFFVNAMGVKRWAFVPNEYLAVLNPPPEGRGYNYSTADLNNPDDPAHPGFESVDRLEAVLEPGDVLYVPSWMWHCVQNESPTIGVRCGFLYPGGMLTESQTLFLARVFAGKNPTFLQGILNTLRGDLPSRETGLLAPKIFRW